MKNINVKIALAILLSIVVGGIIGANYHSKEVREQKTDILATEPDAVTLLDTTGWKTYESKKFGISFKYPKDFTIDVTAGNIRILSEHVSIALEDYRNANLADYIKWDINVYGIDRVFTLSNYTHIVIKYQTASPESADTHIFVDDYPQNLADEGKNKHIIIAGTGQEFYFDGKMQGDRPVMVDTIMDSLRFTK